MWTENMTTLFFFGGAINRSHVSNPEFPENDAGYSFGARQTAWRLFKDLPGPCSPSLPLGWWGNKPWRSCTPGQ